MWDTLHELWQLLKVTKKLWLAPIIIALVLLGDFIAFASDSVVAPLMYTVF